jgi:sulfoxide reductase heme-binding subunit YedZ
LKFVKPVVFVLCLVPAAYLTWAVLTNNLGANPIREAEVQTGLWTLRFLAIALTVTPLRRLTGWNQLSKYRRMLGLFTFFYACIHLSLWFVDWWFDWPAMWDEIVKHKYILVGMLTFLILLALAITSTDGWVRRLRKNWVKLHRLVYVAAITGTIHYLWAVSSKVGGSPTYVYFVVFGVLLGYRLFMAIRKKTSGSPREQSPSRASPG